MKKEYENYIQRLENKIKRYQLLDEILNGKELEVWVEYFPEGQEDAVKKKRVHLAVPAIKEEVVSAIALLRNEQEREFDEAIDKSKSENDDIE